MIKEIFALIFAAAMFVSTTRTSRTWCLDRQTRFLQSLQGGFARFVVVIIIVVVIVVVVVVVIVVVVEG